MSATRTLECAKCGGPLPPEAADRPTSCPFCGAAALPAPRVVERVVVERVVERVVVPADEASRTLCPRCNRPLDDVRTAARVASVCARCGGAWVDKATSEHLARVDDVELATAVRRAAGVVMTVPLREKRATVFCPVCEVQTRRVEIDGTVHVIDVCDEHGTWFDCDELTAFVEHYTERRAGEISEDDLDAAGVGGRSFLSRVFGALFS